MSLFDKKEKQPTPKLSWQQNVSLYLHDLAYMLVIVMILLMLFFRVIVVDGPSMQNTLLNGDYMLLVSNILYKDYKPGDVVVVCKQAYKNGRPIVKRVIATEGQTVDIDFETGVVTVDGVALDEPYISTPTMLREGMDFPVTVKENSVFVLGDNRMNSSDSRNPAIASIDTRELLGRVIFLLFPGTGFTSEPRDFGRIGAVR